MRDLWLTRMNEPFIRYKLLTYDCLKLYNGDYTRIFGLKKYYGEDDNTWKPFGDTIDYLYVDIETLLSEFILLDSPNDKYIKGLKELRDNNFKKTTEESISLFSDIMSDIQSSYVGDLKAEENEGDKENIHTLYSGESETDPSSTPEGVQE